MPKVSVIIAVYNGEHRLIPAVQSILDQTYQDFEIIICDDCSTDNTRSVIENLSRADDRIIYTRSTKNSGAATARNNCIKLARGQYVAIMDDDDYSYPKRLEKQVSFLENNPECDFVSSGIDIFDGMEVVAKNMPKHTSPSKKHFQWGLPFVHPASMFRIEKIKIVNGYRVAKETRRAEDYDLFIRMYAEGMKGYNIPESLLRYYVNPDAMLKRKYIYRIDEAVVRYKGFKLLGLLPMGCIYVIKPLVVGLIPRRILYSIHTKNRGA